MEAYEVEGLEPGYVHPYWKKNAFAVGKVLDWLDNQDPPTDTLEVSMTSGFTINREINGDRPIDYTVKQDIFTFSRGAQYVSQNVVSKQKYMVRVARDEQGRCIASHKVVTQEDFIKDLQRRGVFDRLETGKKRVQPSLIWTP